jgi:CheY-like chemotaxis protein
MVRILLVEDDSTDVELTIRLLRASGIECTWECVDSEGAFRQALLNSPDLIISDGKLPNFDGRSALAIAIAQKPQVPFIFLSGAPWDHHAQEAIDAGAADFICKADRQRIAPAIRRVLTVI